MTARKSLLGLGIGLVTAAGAATVGVAADRLLKARGAAVALGTTGEHDEDPDHAMVVLADDGVRLHVEIDDPHGRPPGAGKDAVIPTVVLSHGYTLSLKSWIFQRRALRRAGYRVVLWDQRGHGRSEAGAPESYDVDQLGHDLGSVIAQAVPEGPLVLVGHSMGGMTMMALAASDHELIRERVVGAAFVSSSAGGLSTVSWGLGKLLGQLVHRVGPLAVARLSGRQSLITSALRRGKDVEEFFVDRYSFASPVPLSIVRLTGDMIFGTDIEVISGFMPTLDRHDKREALAQFIGVETLVLNGAQDLLTPPDHSEEIVRLVPGAEHVVVNDCGHIILLEHPDVVSEQLLALLERAVRAGEATGKEKPAGEAERRAAAPQQTPVRRVVTDVAKRKRDDTARATGRQGAAPRSRAAAVTRARRSSARGSRHGG